MTSNDCWPLGFHSVNGTQVRVRALRAQIRQVAGSLFLHTWQFDAAEELEEAAKLFLMLRGQAPRLLTATQVDDLLTTFG